MSSYQWTDYGIMDTYYIIMADKDRDDLYFQDYQKIRNLKISVSKEFSSYQHVLSHLAEIGIDENNIVWSDSFLASVCQLEEGKADLIFTNVMNFDSEKYKMIDRFHRETNVIVSRYGEELIFDINEAIADILLENPSFFFNLGKKYFPERSLIPFSKAEEVMLNAIGCIYFAYDEDLGYLSGMEDGVFVGIIPEIARAICKKMGIEYREIRIQDLDIAEFQRQDIVYCIAPYLHDKEIALKSNLVLSESVLHSQYNIVYRKGMDVDLTNKKIGIARNIINKEKILARLEPDQTVIFDSIDECLNALNEGEIDLTVMNGYVSSFYLNIFKYNNLGQKPTKGGIDVGFAFPMETSSLIMSAMNKAIRSFTENDILSIISNQTVRIPNQTFFDRVIYAYPATTLIVSLLFLSILLFSVFFVITTNILRKKNKALILATQSQDRFFSQISHDIRTPMNGIIVSTELVKDSTDVAQLHEAITDIRESGQFMMTLLNDVLQISKMQDGDSSLHPEPYSYQEFENTIKSIIIPKAIQKGVSLELHCEPEPYFLAVLDKARIKQIIINLLGNSIKFTPPGNKVKLIVSTSAESTGCRLTFKIIDEGIGMSKEFIENKLYRQFEQEKPDNQGSGLGLYIVKKLVEKMNGTITCESTPGKGTTFTVVIFTECIDSIPDNEVSQMADKKKSSLVGKRVLLVDDHPLNVKVASRILEKEGILIDSAENGLLGSEKFISSEESFYDAILMDIRMPVMDGLQSTAQIRKSSHPQALKIPIIAMSANAMKKDVELSLASGMNAHIPKPVDPEELINVLEILIVEKE